jgi:hypothetical protein
VHATGLVFSFWKQYHATTEPSTTLSRWLRVQKDTSH